ncbi:KxYKxGKxW signal peptide domain-containing protein [Paenibacillus puldeungensis]|uniref:KxYKxGKxW signal peptide domain-containing protein n=1 Tax=Paenibacillus puldeungensis TaxID=696536 RepID=A0ABW3RWB1_9BACL
MINLYKSGKHWMYLSRAAAFLMDELLFVEAARETCLSFS